VLVTGLGVSLLKSSLEMSAQVSLAAMSVKDHMQNGGPDFGYILTTPTPIEYHNHQFITVTYNNIQKVVIY
jgi:hypothetical protein